MIKGKSYKNGAKVTNLSSGEDVDLYAQWTANKYTVVFHSNLAKDTTRKQTLTYDGKETALTANSFRWKGHAFQGWAEAGDAAEPEYINKEKVRNLTTEKTIDLYAVWKVNEYTVVFDPNGAEGEEITQDMTYDVPAELEANRFERQGYTFQGWSTLDSVLEELTNDGKVGGSTIETAATIAFICDIVCFWRSTRSSNQFVRIVWVWDEPR